MKSSKRFLVFISILLNIYGWSIWIYSFNAFTTQEARINNFAQFFPDWFSLRFISVTLLLLGIISIVNLSKDSIFNKAITYLLIIIQVAFTVLNLTTMM